MSQATPAPISPGLCGRCAFARVNQTCRGATYWRCTRAAWDERLAKYPRLPVLACSGFEARRG